MKRDFGGELAMSIPFIVFLVVFSFVIATEVTKKLRLSGPKPVIVSVTCDESSTVIGDYSVRVRITVINRGSEGQVVAEATVSQSENNSWTKTQLLDLRKNETKEAVIDFDEVLLFEGKIKCAGNIYNN